MTQRVPGPFYDYSPAQWAQVRQTHRRFCETKDLGRPLFLPSYFNRLLFGKVEDPPEDAIVLPGPRKRHPEMDKAIRYLIAHAGALGNAKRPHDRFPCLFIDRKHYGHSQRLAEPFGTQTLIEGHHAQAMPVIASLADVAHLRLKPLKECRYLKRSLEVLRYYYESTAGRYYIPHMVTTGACDTVNYATGSTLLLEGFYTNPKAVHQLLRMATEIIIEHIRACKAIAGDRLISDHTQLLDGCYCICSELRSQFSPEHFAEFEAPYLKQIGDAIGPLHIHVSGPIEHSIPATLRDANIRHVKFWLRDSDLAKVVALAGDRLSMAFFENTCMPALAFPDKKAYYLHIFERIRPETRWVIAEYEPEGWNQAYDAMERDGRLPEQILRVGRMPG
ncbi:MAG: hypothetical protein HYV35_02665 [Lentisphaerae bacterium]|nr:hypothetical protein [Lentisphaerota bacterium]